MTESFINKVIELNEFSDRDFSYKCWSAPSNIALAKYWGKRAIQIPENPSVSFTLSTCRTNMAVILSPKKNDVCVRQFYFDGVKNNNFGKKSFNLIEIISKDYPVFNNYDLQVISENTFPHSSGIASSASSMSALSLCLIDILREIENSKKPEADFYQLSSHYARLGSGSACRSIYGGVVQWGSSDFTDFSSDEYAVQIENIHPVFHDFRDSVLIVSSDKKAVSSTAGHEQMDSHPFRQVRYQNAAKNCKDLISLMRKGEVWPWGEIVEKEALELHGLMMNGPESFILLKPNTLNIIERVRTFRLDKNIPVFFTLDAGPNVHLLYPKEFKEVVEDFISKDLVEFCENEVWFNDFVGNGPQSFGGQQC